MVRDHPQTMLLLYGNFLLISGEIKPQFPTPSGGNAIDSLGTSFPVPQHVVLLDLKHTQVPDAVYSASRLFNADAKRHGFHHHCTSHYL